MNVSETEQRAPLKEESNDKDKAIKMRAKDSTQTESTASTAESHSEDSSKNATVKVEESTTVAQAKIEGGWTPARHPMLLKNPSDKYFVNKAGEFRSITPGRMKTLTPEKNYRTTAYRLPTATKQRKEIRLNEIMMWTFRGGLDGSQDRIFHIDGDLKNCALNNLEVCSDLPTLHRLEIALREKLCPGTKYTTIKDLDGKTTYSKYLVSDAGHVFSLHNRRHLSEIKRTYTHFRLSADFDREKEVSISKLIVAHELVMRSFRGPPPPSTPYIKHINGDLHDNHLDNLQYDSVEEAELKKKPKRGPSPGTQYPDRDKEIPPLPEATDETRWHTIGHLPWRKSVYSKYEVSDMGHVRRIGSTKCLDVRRNYQGHLCVTVYRDRHDSEETIELYPISYPQAPVCYLVAYKFVKGYSKQNGIVIHKDGDIQNNSWENLKWVKSTPGPRSSTGRRVIARLVDDPSAEKEFDNLRHAQLELAVYLRRRRFIPGESIVKEVIWDGKRRMAMITVY